MFSYFTHSCIFFSLIINILKSLNDALNPACSNKSPKRGQKEFEISNVFIDFSMLTDFVGNIKQHMYSI